MAKKGSGLTITERANGSWRAQIRKAGFPYQSKDFLSHQEADEWGLLRKLLASSSLATAGTLDTLRARLETLRDEQIKDDPEFAERLIESEDIEDELLDDILASILVGRQAVGHDRSSSEVVFSRCTRREHSS